ncbi:MAG: hypothetical protein ABIG85_01835 [Chloroflexota bacterium]
MSESTIDVRCGSDGVGWLCLVRAREGPFATEHRVTVGPADLARLDPAGADPERLVRAAFGFLLERESASSILRSFDLPVIGRYFPGWEDDVRGRLGR